MKLNMSPPVVEVTLSRRNLVGLLKKLDGFPKNSHRTLESDEGDFLLVVVAEEDTDHYGSRGYPPGPMHPDTELAMRSDNDQAE